MSRYPMWIDMVRLTAHCPSSQMQTLCLTGFSSEVFFILMKWLKFYLNKNKNSPDATFFITKWRKRSPSHSSASNCNWVFFLRFFQLTPHLPPHFLLKPPILWGRVVSFGVALCLWQSVLDIWLGGRGRSSAVCGSRTSVL